MKKLSLFLLSINFVLSACGTPAPVVPTATPAFTETSTPTPASTETPTPVPAFTETTTPVPASVEPYAVVSSDKAEFWFPLPDRQKYGWGIPETFGADHIWFVKFGNPQEYVRVAVLCGALKRESSQTGSFEDMLETCESRIGTSSGGKGDDSILYSYSNGGLLIQLTDPVLVNRLMTDTPQDMLFQITRRIRMEQSETPPLSAGPYAVLLPDRAEFWFQLPAKTTWTWNKPVEYIWLTPDSRQTFAYWSVEFGNKNVQVGCWTEWANLDTPVQTGSFEDLLKTCRKELSYRDHVTGRIDYIVRNPPAASYTNGGLLVQLTDPEFVEFLYQNPSQPIFFNTSEAFHVTPIYK